MTPVIKTPRGTISTGPEGKAELVWDTTFKQKWQGQYSTAQRWVDSEVLRRCEPYVPLRTSMLIKSGILGTEIGSGEVKWIAPYARWQYYHKRAPGSQTGPLRGPHWFDRMKVTHGATILKVGKQMAGKGKR